MPKLLSNIARIASNLLKSFPGTKNKILILELTKKELRMGLVTGPGRVDSFTKLSLRELPDEDLVLRIANFARSKGFIKACLILPKAQIIERHIDISLDEEKEWKEVVMKRIEESLPVSPSELSHGMELERTETQLRVHLLAYPLQFLKKFLALVDQAGVDLDEILSSDQTLLWCSLVKVSASSCLVLNFDEEVVELLFREGSKIVFSRVLRCEEGNPIHEIEFALLECLKKPDTILVLGKIDSEVESVLRKTFSVPIERWSADGVSPAVYGGSFVGRYPSVSLLPQEKKLERRKRETRRKRGELGFLSCILVAAIFFCSAIHKTASSTYLKRMELTVAPLRLEMKKLEKVTKILHFLRQKEVSHWVFLEFLRQLDLAIPRQVVLNQVSFDNLGLKLKGTSSSYSGVAEMLQFLDKAEFINASRLEYARLRKKESKEFFEFEMEGSWKTESLKEDHGTKGKRQDGEKSFARELGDKKKELQRLKTLGAKSPFYLAAYKKMVQAYPHFEKQDDFISDFMREMGARFESHKLRILKIEPQGLTPLQIPGADGVEMKLVIQIEGSMKGLVAFLYEIASGNMNEIHSLDIAIKPERRETLSIEMVLGRILP